MIKLPVSPYPQDNCTLSQAQAVVEKLKKFGIQKILRVHEGVTNCEFSSNRYSAEGNPTGWFLIGGTETDPGKSAAAVYNNLFNGDQGIDQAMYVYLEFVPFDEYSTFANWILSFDSIQHLVHNYLIQNL